MPAKGSAEWQGDLKSGSGTFTAGDSISGEYSFKSRFEDGPGANPEQLIAGAHAACFSMALSNILAGIYRADRWHDLSNLPEIDYWTLPLFKPDAFRSSWLYRMYFFWPIMFSRGCPHPCEYCAVQTYYKRSYRTRPVDEFVAEIDRMRALGASRFLFLDDNPIAHPEKAMIPSPCSSKSCLSIRGL